MSERRKLGNSTLIYGTSETSEIRKSQHTNLRKLSEIRKTIVSIQKRNFNCRKLGTKADLNILFTETNVICRKNETQAGLIAFVVGIKFKLSEIRN